LVRGVEGSADPVPTILVAGIVRHVERLHALGRIERTRWGALARHVASLRADLVVVGGTPPDTDVADVVATIRKDDAVASVPVLHASPGAESCADCGADVCLPSGDVPGPLLQVARLLLELHRVAPSDPGSAVAPPARSQRLEALGRLASGIVHDFNNLLFVMTGQVELARRQLGRDHPAAARLLPVLEAVDRAGELTRQLLAYTRGSRSEIRLVDLNAVVTRLDRMLQRVIGEDVAIEIRTGPDLGPIRADPSQMEQVILNLALNAREAMPKGGHLAIETRDVDVQREAGPSDSLAPGRYVTLTVSDDGVGMDEETRARIFEPFFTTRPETGGSGLGLASVHDIVEDAGGLIRVDSRPGAGATFTIYLPRADEEDEPAHAAAGEVAPPRGGETLLVAEDSEAVRDVTRELLEGLGYTVLLASRGAEALAVAEAYRGPIHLLLTDVVMPGLRGDSLATEMKALRPDIRVLFMSGYGDGVLARASFAGEEATVLRKPFGQERLAQAIRETLDRRP
jgi:two-component system cell cycle sensor histidine kinase/response regulator CckA